MAELRARQFDYSVALDRAGRVTAEAGQPVEIPDEWAPEHLVLGGLARCTLTSLRYHAKRAGITFEAEATVQGTVTRREKDGRFAFVAIDCRFAVRLDPKPSEQEVAALLEKAERDCFVGASLKPSPRYEWSVA